MLDRDLATLYGVETRTLNQAVKRNIQRFPSDFRFQLAMEEYSKSQIEEYHSFREKITYLQPIITQYFIDNKSEIWLLFLIAHSKR